MLKITLLTGIFSLLTMQLSAQVQCEVDVQIAEGTNVTVCQSQPSNLNATVSAGFVAYVWNGPVMGTTSSITPTSSGQYIVFAEDTAGCISSDTIQVTVQPVPVDNISSSAGDTLCDAGSSILSLTNPYVTYNWSGGVNTTVLNVSESGTYYAEVTDTNGCPAIFEYTIVIMDFDVEISSQSDCVNSVTLQASGGSSYNWSTGELSSTIVVTPEVPTTYSVNISEGSCSSDLSIMVQPFENPLPVFSIQDTFYITEGENFTISGPANFHSYHWSPGNQLNDSTEQIASFIGSETQTITLTAISPSGCVIEETFTIIVVSLTIPDGFSPNNDSYNDFFEIPELENYQGKLVVWNRWGDIVYQSDDYQNDWRGTCETGFCFGEGNDVTDGTYFYSLTIADIRKEGYITILR